MVHDDEGVYDRDHCLSVEEHLPPVSASSAESTNFLSVWKTVRMGLFIFGLGVSVGGG